MPFAALPYKVTGTVSSFQLPRTPAATVIDAVQAFAKGGGGSSGVKAAAGAIGTAAFGPVGGVAAELLGNIFDFGTSSKANWNRTGGRIARAVALGYLPSISGAEGILRQLKAQWLAAGDSTGAQFWDRIVQVFGIPTEKGGTKEGFNSGAPAGSKIAEKQPGYKALEAAVIAALG